MTVKELIEQLQALPENAPVYLIEPSGNCYTVERVVNDHRINLSCDVGCDR